MATGRMVKLDGFVEFDFISADFKQSVVYDELQQHVTIVTM